MTERGYVTRRFGQGGEISVYFMFKKSDVKIEIVTPNSTFYIPGDHIKGKLIFSIEKHTNYKDIQIKLRCDELSTIHTDRSVMEYDFVVGDRQPHFGKRDVRERSIKRDNSIVDMTSYESAVRHFELTSTVANPQNPTNLEEHESSLSPGQHVFEFDILLPHTTQTCPPQCEIDDKLGIKWILKAVMHRSGLKKNIRKEILLPVYPPQAVHTELPDWRVRDEVVKTHIFNPSKVTPTNDEYVLNAHLGFRKAGIPQPLSSNRIKPSFTLLLNAPQRAILVKSVDLKLVLLCDTSLDNKKALNSTHEKIVPFGHIRVNQLASPKLDLTSRMKPLVLDQLHAPPFEAKQLRVHYKLRADIECEFPGVNDSSQNMQLETDIVVVDPHLCWETLKLPSYEELTSDTKS